MKPIYKVKIFMDYYITKLENKINKWLELEANNFNNFDIKYSTAPYSENNQYTIYSALIQYETISNDGE